MKHPFLCARRREQLFVARAQRFLRAHAIGDVVGDAAHDWRLDSLSAQSVVILPDAAFSGSRYQRQQAVSFARVLDFAQISIELVEELWIDEIPHGRTQHFFHAVAEQTRGKGIDSQKSAFKVVDAQKILTVLEEIATPVFVFLQVPPNRVPYGWRFFRE